MYSAQKTTIIAVLIAVLVLYSHANTKPPPADLGYEPPDGWEFVMKLDTLSGLFLHCHNDTCFIVASFAGSREIPFFLRLSTDGGETWEDIPDLPPRNFKHNSNALHRMIFDFDENKRFYEVSYDLFKTSERYQDAKLSLNDKDLLESPIDTNLLISVHEGKQSTHTGEIHAMSAQVSRNAGRNWEVLELFRYWHGFTTYQFNFDWAEKRHWFYKSGDGYDELDYEREPDKYFETFDDGRTFREIKFDPASDFQSNKNFGVNGFRTMTEKIKYYARGINVKQYDDSIKSNNFYDWLYLSDPSKPKSNIDSGYRRAITFLDDYYHNDNKNLSNHVVRIFEDIGDIKNKNFRIEHLLYHSTDNGKSWDLINELGENPFFYSSVLDQGNKTLWIHVKDEPYQWGKNHTTYKGSLWKLKLPWGASSVENLKSEDGFSVYPNPAREYIEIFYGSIGASSNENNIWASPNASNIMLFNTLGESVVSESIHPMTPSHRMNIEHLPNGVYFVKITMNNKIYVKKIMVFK
jgi:hypothetical protein